MCAHKGVFSFLAVGLLQTVLGTSYLSHQAGTSYSRVGDGSIQGAPETGKPQGCAEAHTGPAAHVRMAEEARAGPEATTVTPISHKRPILGRVVHQGVAQKFTGQFP